MTLLSYLCSLSCLQGDLGDGEVEDSKVGDIMRHGSVEWLTASFGQSTQANAWAGPDHWKYHKPRGKCCNNPFLVFPACHRTSMDDCRVYANCNFLVLISVVCQVLPFVLIQVPRVLFSSSPVLHKDPLSQVSFSHHSFTTCF